MYLFTCMPLCSVTWTDQYVTLMFSIFFFTQPQDDYSVLFEDTSYPDGYSPPLLVAQRYVICCKEDKKKWGCVRTFEVFPDLCVWEQETSQRLWFSTRERLFPERCDVLNSDMHHFHLCLRQQTPPSRLNYCGYLPKVNEKVRLLILV